MQGTTLTAQEVYARLQRYREAQQDIAFSDERLTALRDQAYGLGAAKLDGMPRSQSKPVDRLGALIAQIAEVEEILSEDIQAQQTERETLEAAIRQIRKAERRAVIRLRYFDGLAWGDVCNTIFGARPDFLEKEDSYLRRTMKAHKSGIEDLSDILNQQNQQKIEKES